MSSFFEAELHLVIPRHWELYLESYTILKTPNPTNKKKKTPIQHKPKKKKNFSYIFLIRSIRPLRKPFPSKSKEDSIFGFFLRLTAARHKEYKLYLEFFHFIISLLKYLKHWTTHTGKKSIYFMMGEDKRWLFGMLSYSCSKDFGFRWINCFH